MRRAAWVVTGGEGDDVGHCERCGVGLSIQLPMPLYLVAAMMESFVKLHAQCAAPQVQVRKGPALRRTISEVKP
jgi:hypothetical protein